MRKHIYLPIIGLTVLLLSGCAYHVFDDPMTISTSSAAAKNYQPIRPVKVVTCDYWFLKTSVEHEFQDLWKRLLSEAEKAGGTAVIDAQFHGADGSFYWMIPPFGRTCWEARGIAARRL
jgi:hypothetical protein